jgi:hypothetical protein
MKRLLIQGACLAVLGLVLCEEGQAQAPPPVEPDTFQLVFDREVFEYPGYQRRNPFRPLTGNDTGPRFEEVRLLGVVLSSEPNGSVALLGSREARSGRGADPARTFRVRHGEVLGNMRVMAIHRREIVVQVDEFGIVDTRVLELRRTEPEAQPGADDPAAGSPAAETIPGSPGDAIADPDTTRPPANGNGGSV